MRNSELVRDQTQQSQILQERDSQVEGLKNEIVELQKKMNEAKHGNEVLKRENERNRERIQFEAEKQ